MGCCGSSRSKFNVEFYKWSSAEFSEEYALIYRYYGQAEAADAEPESCSIFQWRVNPDMVICRLVDYVWTNPQIPARIHMKVTTERDSNGVYNFRKVRVAADGTHKHDDDDDVEQPPQPRVMVYLSYNNDGCSYVVQRRDQSIVRGNLNKTIWEVKHSYHITLRKSLRFHMSIQCDRETGLRAEFSGPLKCKGLFSEKVVGLKIDREVEGEPPRAFIREVETEFKGEEFTLLKPQSRKDNSRAPPSSASSSVTGLVNNIGTQIQVKEMKVGLSNFATAMVIFSSLKAVLGIRFVIDREDCFYHNVQYEGDRVQASFVVIKIDTSWQYTNDGVDLSVKGPSGETIKDFHDMTSEIFEFVARDNGPHRFCFTNKSPYHETIDFDVHSNHVHFTDQHAKDEHLTPLLDQIMKLEQALFNIQYEQHWLEAQTERQAIVSNALSSRAMHKAILESMALMGASALQVYLLRRLFERKLAI